MFRCTICLLLLAVVWAAQEEEHADDRTSPAVTKPGSKLPSEFSLPANMMNLVVAAGALVVGVIGVGILLALLLPLFGLKMCHLLGTCDAYAFVPSQPYDAYANHAATFNAPQPAYAPTSYQKRSLEYMGPVLQALSMAYDKYARSEVASADAQPLPIVSKGQ